MTVPIGRLAQVVCVSTPVQDKAKGNIDPKPPERPVRAKLADGSALIFEPAESKDGMLSGHSTIYGETAIPIASIQELNLDNFEREGFKRPFTEWVVHPAKEPEFGESSHSSHSP